MAEATKFAEEDGTAVVHQSISPALTRAVPASPTQLSTFQKKQLIQCWQHLSKTGNGSFSSIVFQRICSKRPELRDLFTKATVSNAFRGSGGSLTDHQKFLIDLIEKLIQNLDCLAAVEMDLIELGRAHAHLNDCNDFNIDLPHKELVRAWMSLIAFAIDKIRHGYVSRLRQLQFQKSQPTRLTVPGLSIAGRSKSADDSWLQNSEALGMEHIREYTDEN